MASNVEEAVALQAIKSFKDLTLHGQALSDEGGARRVLYTWMVYVDPEERAYFGQSEIGIRELSAEDMQKCLQRIPDEEIFPLSSQDTPIVSGPVPKHLYVKKPDFKSWDEHQGRTDLADLLKGEIETLKLLSKHPHPNIAQYHGCLVHRGRIKGIVLENYPVTLKDALEGPSTVNLEEQQRTTIVKEITSAIKHLHSLGLAHNDLNPYNVMLDADNQPHLIDFGSCKPTGSLLMEWALLAGSTIIQGVQTFVTTMLA